MIVIGVETLTPEVVEGEDALVNVEILFGSLEKEVLVTLSTLDESAQGTCIYVCMQVHVHMKVQCFDIP